MTPTQVVVSFNKQLPPKDDGLRASDCYSISLIPSANNLLQVWFFNYYVKCNLFTMNITYKKKCPPQNLPLFRPKSITFSQNFSIKLIHAHKTKKFPSSSCSWKQCALPSNENNFLNSEYRWRIISNNRYFTNGWSIHFMKNKRLI